MCCPDMQQLFLLQLFLLYVAADKLAEEPGIEEYGAPGMLLQAVIAAELLAQPPPCQNARAELPQITQWPGYDNQSVPLLSPPLTQSLLVIWMTGFMKGSTVHFKTLILQPSCR